MTRSGDCPLARSYGHPGEIANPQQVIDREPEDEHPADPRQSTVAGLAQQSDRLEPAEDLLDTFPSTLRRFVVFCATCGVTPSARRVATKSRVSYALSAASVARARLIAPAARTTAASRSALAPAEVSRPPTARPWR